MLLRAIYIILCLTLSDASINFVDEKDVNIECKKKTCVHKCCPIGEYIIKVDEYEYNCEPHESDLDFTNIPLYDDNEHGKIVDSKLGDLWILPNFENFNSTSDVTDTARFTLTEKGRLQIEFPNIYDRWEFMGVDKYCIEYVALDTYPNQTELHYWVTYEDSEAPPNSLYNMAAMCMSCIFLGLVLLVYCLLPELRNLAGKILMAYVLSLLLAFLSLSSVQVNTYDEDTCLGITAVIYYSFLASFCWMNVMSYDIFWTFRGYAKARRIHRRGENFKFLMYCLYAWGAPLPMTIFLVVMNNVDFSDKPWIIKPQIGVYGCFLVEGQKFVYLYIPMLILIACNWFFYMLTVFNIWRLSRGTAVLHQASDAAGNASAHQAQKGRFMIYLKLSVVMGVNWLLEIIKSLCENLSALWWIVDIYNLLVGFLIFLIFVCKKKIFQDIKAKFLSFQLQYSRSCNSRTSATKTSTLNPNQSQDMSQEVSKHPDGLVRGRRYDVSV